MWFPALPLPVSSVNEFTVSDKAVQILGRFILEVSQWVKELFENYRDDG